MQQAGNNIKDFDQYLGRLTQQFYPNQFIHTSGCTILTNFTNHKIGKYIGSNQVYHQKSKETTFPKVCLKVKQINTTIINSQRNFFISEDKQLMNASTVNFLYLLTVYAKVRIMVVITAEDIKDQKKNQLLYIFKQLSNIFKGKTQVQKRFGQCIGILIQDGAQLGMQKCISEMSKIPKQLSQFSKNLLDNIIKNKKIVLSGAKRLLKDNLLQLKAIPQFQTAPKTLTQLYHQILIPEQLIYLERIYKTYYSQPCNKTLNILKQAFENKQIFNQDEVVRLDAIYNNFNMIPFNFQTPKDLKKREKKIDKFACQSAYIILDQLSKYQADLLQKDKKQGFILYNLKNLDNQWNQNSLNLSIVGKIIQIVFSDLSIYHNPYLLKIANYLHSQFRFFENIPKNQIRKQQYNRIQDIQQLIRLLIQFFFENLNYTVQMLIKDSKKMLSAQKLLYLTADIKNLIKFLNKIKTINRNPYKDIADDIQNHLILIVSSFFFCSWKCYEVYKKFWSRNQKNCFMIELYEICKNKQYKQYFQRMMIKPVHIFKRVNQYFGDLYAKNKQYFISTKFYIAGRLNWKLIQNINLWLQKILQQQIYSMNDITQGITKLSNLGLGQQARKWCYKFMDKIDNNSQFISLLEDITNYQINQQKIVLEQISKLKYNQLNVVEDKYFNEIKYELILEEWLIYQL